MEILEIFIGLSLVYLLLSLLCTAINEYIATMLDKRGKELIRGVDQLLGERDEALKAAFYKHPLIASLYPDRSDVLAWEEKLTKWGGWWRPLRPLYRLASFVLRPSVRNRRRPSYIPARNFALALLDVTSYTRAEGLRQDRAPQPGGGGAVPAPVPTPAELRQALEALRNTSGADVSELLLSPEVGALLSSYAVPPDVRQRLVSAVAGVENELQRLHDSVEVWFNNTMDRVSGTYKRYTQIALVYIGFAVAFVANADTLQIWRTLAINDDVRQAMVLRAESTARELNAARARRDSALTAQRDSAITDSLRQAQAQADSPAAPRPAGVLARGLDSARVLSHDSAAALYATARAALDSAELNLGWTREDVRRLGVLKPLARGSVSLGRRFAGAAVGPAGGAPSVSVPAPVPADGGFEPRFWRWHWGPILAKLLGLVLTGIALSLGAPFWFDTLNRFINIRGAGRAPHERAKAPETTGKRAAERPTK